MCDGILLFINIADRDGQGEPAPMVVRGIR
jgi:hypothetical protein